MAIASTIAWGIAFDQHTVLEGAGFTFVCVADDVFLFRWGAGDELPFETSGEASAAAAAQAGCFELVNNIFGLHVGKDGCQGLVAIIGDVVFDAGGVNQTSAR